jgi:hypothetical protein
VVVRPSPFARSRRQGGGRRQVRRLFRPQRRIAVKRLGKRTPTSVYSSHDRWSICRAFKTVSREGALGSGMTRPERDRWFESGFLQRRVTREPHLGRCRSGVTSAQRRNPSISARTRPIAKPRRARRCRGMWILAALSFIMVGNSWRISAVP